MSTTGQTVTTRIQHRRGTTAEWNFNGGSVILGRGEYGIEFYDNSSPFAGLEVGFKVGDGVTPWSQLLYHRPDPGIKANGRAQRDLSVFGNIGQQGTARDFATLADAVDAILHPYVPPTISLGADRQGTYEVGKVIDPITLDLFLNGQGSFPVRQRTIYRVDNGAIIQQENSATGFAPGSHMYGTVNGLTLPKPGTVQYQGNATNTRPGANDTVYSNQVNYGFQYPVFFGYANNSVFNTLNDSDLRDFILKGFAPGSVTNANGITTRLAGNRYMEINASPLNQYLLVAYPKEMGTLTDLTQYVGSTASPQFGNYQGPKEIVFSQVNGSAFGGAWANIPYYIYQKKDATGNGTPMKYISQ
jgi:hypothetical protein